MFTINVSKTCSRVQERMQACGHFTSGRSPGHWSHLPDVPARQLESRQLNVQVVDLEVRRRVDLDRQRPRMPRSGEMGFPDSDRTAEKYSVYDCH